MRQTELHLANKDRELIESYQAKGVHHAREVNRAHIPAQPPHFGRSSLPLRKESVSIRDTINASLPDRQLRKVGPADPDNRLYKRQVSDLEPAINAGSNFSQCLLMAGYCRRCYLHSGHTV